MQSKTIEICDLIKSRHHNFSFLEDVEKIIETQLSMLLFYPKIVIKLCKDSNKDLHRDIIDLEDRLTRLSFFYNDFHFNRNISPHVHIALLPVTIAGERVTLSSPDSNFEWISLMRRVEEETNVLTQLTKKKLTSSDYLMIGKQFYQRTKVLKSENIEHLDYCQLMNMRLRDLRRFASISRQVYDDIRFQESVSCLHSFLLQRSSDYFNINRNLLSPGLDSHCGNLYFDVRTRQLELLDLYQVKKNWRIVDPLLNIARTTADIAVLDKRIEGHAAITSYLEESRRELPSNLLSFYWAYSCLIMAVVRFTQKKEEQVEKYLDFAFEEVRNV